MPTGRLDVYTDANGYAACHPGTLTPIRRSATKTVTRKADRKRRAKASRAARARNR